MTGTIRVFVNERPVEVPAGSDGRAAVRAADPQLSRSLTDGSAYLTDGRGIETSPDLPVQAGAILRVVISHRSPSD